MKKLLLLSALALAASASSALAATAGTFGYGIELTGTGAGAINNGVNTLYSLDNGGGSRLDPIVHGTDVTLGTLPALLSTAWTSSSTGALPSFSLGTFTTTDSLVLDGGSFLTFKNSGDNVSSAYLNFRLNAGSTGSGSYSPGLSLAFNEDNVGGNTGDQRWATSTEGINLLTGLTPGVYTLTTYGVANANSGSYYESNSGNDFAATFTVVAAPEPGTWAMMLGGLGVLVLFQARRRTMVG